MLKLACLCLLIAGCTDSTRAQLYSLGKPGTIACYSGGQKIYEGQSTGKIATEENSDGWFFNEAGTNKLVRISGSCIVRN